MLFKASAPGSLMLLGEYAVLHGKQALVCALNQRVSVTLQPRTGTKISIISALGNLEIDISKIACVPPFQFVLAVLKKFRKQLPSGCVITIEAEFSAQLGLGSSAAVTVALLAALTAWLEQPMTAEELIHSARAVVREVQGIGSGADVAASVLGGMVAYQARPLRAERLQPRCELTAVYAGYKTPTVKAIEKVKTFFADYPRLFKQICDAIGGCAIQGIAATRAQDWPALGHVMTIQQGLMEALGVSTPQLQELITSLRARTEILGAKISGAGLGDCIVGVGTATDFNFNDENIKLVPVEISAQGVCCEKI